MGEVEKGRGCLGRRKMRWRSKRRKPGKDRAIRTQRNEEKKMLRFNDHCKLIHYYYHAHGAAMCMYEGKAITRCGGVIISISKGKGGIWFLVLLEER